MTDSQADLTPADIADYIRATYPETDVFSAPEGDATFFSLNPETHWPNFATIVTSDRHDMEQNSNLVARGLYRLNIGVLPATFKKIVEPGVEYDYTATDTLMPHPVYAAQRWIAVVSPSRSTFDETVKPLLDEAYNKVARTKA
jgi:hypothetical protein